MTEQYLLRSRGFFYRPNFQGYTEYICDAGLYSEEEASRICDNSRVVPMLFSEMRESLLGEIAQQETVLAEMKKQLSHLDATESANKRLSDGGTNE